MRWSIILLNLILWLERERERERSAECPLNCLTKGDDFEV